MRHPKRVPAGKNWTECREGTLEQDEGVLQQPTSPIRPKTPHLFCNWLFGSFFFFWSVSHFSLEDTTLKDEFMVTTGKSSKGIERQTTFSLAPM